uniref:C-C motif chemokine 15-like isoform X2 n=1 Tax=Halichoerus grypus TaxID=9711 RepID=UPI0016594D9D|nr:C-C motif chemokine 15-like isoform X2 [Halichoerus grypus]
MRPVETARQGCHGDFSPLLVCFSQTEPMEAKLQHEPLIHMEGKGFHRPSDCCPDYKRKIRCANMKDFFETSSGCSRPGVIFLTKKERLVCADPLVLEVQNCMRSLRKNLTMQMLLEKKEY